MLLYFDDIRTDGWLLGGTRAEVGSRKSHGDGDGLAMAMMRMESAWTSLDSGSGSIEQYTQIIIDYDDFWTTREILVAGYRPRVLINEYNVNFGQSWSVSTVPKPIGEEAKLYWKGDCYFGVSAPALIHLMQAFGYTPVFSNDVNLIFVQLDQALELGMLIPSIDRFPGPAEHVLHKSCPGRTWKEIDSEIVKSKASDKTLSHTEFAALFSDIVLYDKEYKAPKAGDPAWRTFYQKE